MDVTCYYGGHRRVFLDPFGTIEPESIPAGDYCNYGYIVLKQHYGKKLTWTKCLSEIQKAIAQHCDQSHLKVLGFGKEGATVFNLVNGRSFCGTDAEHMLCKLWMAIKYTFAHNRFSKNPIMSNSHTHPHPSFTMDSTMYPCKILLLMESAFYENQGNNRGNKFYLPDVCKIPGEFTARSLTK